MVHLRARVLANVPVDARLRVVGRPRVVLTITSQHIAGFRQTLHNRVQQGTWVAKDSGYPRNGWGVRGGGKEQGAQDKNNDSDPKQIEAKTS
jgi:hypothetical protein